MWASHSNSRCDYANAISKIDIGQRSEGLGHTEITHFALKCTYSQRNISGFLNVLLLSCTLLLCIQLVFESLVTIECLFVYCH